MHLGNEASINPVTQQLFAISTKKVQKRQKLPKSTNNIQNRPGVTCVHLGNEASVNSVTRQLFAISTKKGTKKNTNSTQKYQQYPKCTGNDLSAPWQ